MKSVEEITRISGMSIFRVRNWAREQGMKRTSGRYFFDEAQEAAFLSRRTREGAPRSARTIAKKTGWSAEKVVKWAREHGVEKREGSYYFTLDQEQQFEREAKIPVGRPKKEQMEVTGPKRPRGRPRKEKQPKVSRPRGRPRKII
jgi:type III secretion system FlhB-like substrate exporter